jgi:hypothetical protein
MALDLGQSCGCRKRFPAMPDERQRRDSPRENRTLRTVAVGPPRATSESDACCLSMSFGSGSGRRVDFFRFCGRSRSRHARRTYRMLRKCNRAKHFCAASASARHTMTSCYPYVRIAESTQSARNENQPTGWAITILRSDSTVGSRRWQEEPSPRDLPPKPPSIPASLPSRRQSPCPPSRGRRGKDTGTCFQTVSPR